MLEVQFTGQRGHTAAGVIDVKNVQIKIKNVTSSKCSSVPRLMPKKWPSRQLGICHSV